MQLMVVREHEVCDLEESKLWPSLMPSPPVGKMSLLSGGMAGPQSVGQTGSRFRSPVLPY